MSFYYVPKKGGVFSPDNQLMPHPGRIFRRQALLDIVDCIPNPHLSCPDAPDNSNGSKRKACLTGMKYLELGCGTGIFAYEFYRLGVEAFVYDLSEDILNTADNIFNSDKERLHILHSLTAEKGESYDIVAAYSVLEHIEKDLEMLEYWSEFLKPGGTFILSVPARMKHWTTVDDVAGHLRRYEKSNLLGLFQQAHLNVEKCISIGFPFEVIISKITSAFVWKKRLRELEGLNDTEKTAVSGTVSGLYKFHKLLPYRTLVLMAKMQRLFYRTDWGVDFVVVARKGKV